MPPKSDKRNFWFLVMFESTGQTLTLGDCTKPTVKPNYVKLSSRLHVLYNKSRNTMHTS